MSTLRGRVSLIANICLAVGSAWLTPMAFHLGAVETRGMLVDQVLGFVGPCPAPVLGPSLARLALRSPLRPKVVEWGPRVLALCAICLAAAVIGRTLFPETPTYRNHAGARSSLYSLFARGGVRDVRRVVAQGLEIRKSNGRVPSRPGWEREAAFVLAASTLYPLRVARIVHFCGGGLRGF